MTRIEPFDKLKEFYNEMIVNPDFPQSETEAHKSTRLRKWRTRKYIFVAILILLLALLVVETLFGDGIKNVFIKLGLLAAVCILMAVFFKYTDKWKTYFQFLAPDKSRQGLKDHIDKESILNGKVIQYYIDSYHLEDPIDELTGIFDEIVKEVIYVMAVPFASGFMAFYFTQLGGGKEYVAVLNVCLGVVSLILIVLLLLRFLPRLTLKKAEQRYIDQRFLEDLMYLKAECEAAEDERCGGEPTANEEPAEQK